MSAARRVLILAPHPDDEIVACGIAAMRARAAGAKIFVLYLTTGVPERGALWPWQRAGWEARIARRRSEAEQAAALVGLQAVGFRDTPARRLRTELGAAARDIDRAILSTAAEAVWVTAFEGGHQDHDAANALAAAVAERMPVCEFAAYSRAGGRVRANSFARLFGDETVIAASAAETAAKRRALACYGSERGNLRGLGGGQEICRPIPDYDYMTRPHPGRLFRERFQWVPFRHPRIDFDTSGAVYRDIGAWFAARHAHTASAAHAAALGHPPGHEAGQPHRELARPLDEA